MAKHKDAKKVSVVGAILVAAIIGLIIGAVIYYEPGTPLPSPDDVEFKGDYDDTWGKLERPEQRVTVSQVLVMVNDTRDDAAAKKLIDQIWHKYRNDPTEKNWKDLQTTYNEDTADKHKKYPIPAPQEYVPEFTAVGKTTKAGFARIAKTSYGYHLIRRDN